MGSTKLIEPTGGVPVPTEISELSYRIRESLNNFENQLATEFPIINSATAIPHLILQQAWYDYCSRLSDEIEREKIKTSGVTPLLLDVFSDLTPNFVKYLQQFGKIGLSNYANSNPRRVKVGIFLKNKNKSELIGILESRFKPEQRSYEGYVPINPEQSRLFTTPVYHLSEAPKIEGINFAFVRLFAERKGQSWERYDAYATRGIEFP